MKVSAVFSAPFSNAVSEILSEYDIDNEEDLIITRKLTLDGKTDIKVNGNTLNNSMLKNITSHLIDIHGQHEHQHLLKDKYHLGIIDLFIKDKSVFDIYVKRLAELKEVKFNIKKLNGSTQNQERMLDLLDYQIKEIQNAKLNIGEDEELMQKRILMLNSEKVYESLNNAINELDGQGSLIDGAKKAAYNLNSIVKYDSSIETLSGRLESVKYELLDILEILKGKKENCSFDQNEFDEIDARLDLIKTLKKKYGATIEDILLFLENAKNEYDIILNSRESLEKLLIDKEKLIKEIYSEGLKISKIRKEIAINFEKSVKEQLNDLGMKNSKFKVEFEDLPSEDLENLFQLNGMDNVKFLFSANAGQGLKPLSEIISGGEASRFMLALKNILAQLDNINCMVFDEIDTGISGDMGYKVACKLANISKTCQVMSISHLPQICAMADYNVKVVKIAQQDNTVVSACVLKEEDILKEVSRLSGGSKDSKISIEHARELRNRCIEYKKNI